MIAFLLAQLVAQRAPTPVTAKIGAPIAYRIRQITPPLEKKFPDPKSHDLIFRVDGKLIHVHAPEQSGKVTDETLAGKDGSLWVDYYVPIDPGGYSAQKIITNHPERKLLAKAFDPAGPYQDASNYIRSYYVEKNPLQMPLGPATTIQVVNDKVHQLGMGFALKTWWPDRVLVNIAVDKANFPQGYEFTDHGFLRLYDKGRPIEIGPYDFLGMVDDKTFAVTSGQTVYMWRETGFVSARSVPPGYRFLAVNPKGDVLLRSLPGNGRELLQKAGIKGVKKVFDRLNDAQETWNMAILRQNTLLPLAFPRPPKTQRFLWHGTQTFDAKDRIRFSTFNGDVERYYELAR